MAILTLICKMIISSGLLYGYYHFFLRNQRFHRYNRFFLLAASLVSLAIPFIHIPIALFGSEQQQGTLIKTLRVINANGWEEPVTIYASRNFWSQWESLPAILYFFYLAGVTASAVVFIRSLLSIQRMRRLYPFERYEQFKVYQTREPGTPFSFFRSVFWNSQLSFDDSKAQQIFRHELFHVKEKHSSDVLLMEILCCICWCNPFFHLIKKELRAIHEFLADEYAISASDRYEYAELLVTHAIAQKKLQLAHPFFNNQIKRRITMITQSNLVRRSGYISRLMALPLLFLLVSAFAIRLKHQPFSQQLHQYLNKSITVVVDAGHGGKFPGANNIGMAEKDINLEISQKIKQLSAEYNVNVVLTRNSDELVGNAIDLREDLLNRVKISDQAKPDMFISIHVNQATGTDAAASTGFEVYISRNNEAEKTRQFASAILGELKNIYAIDETIKQRDMGIAVIDKKTYPAILLECGYLNNPTDLAFITNKDNQEKIARKILEGIVKYGNTQAAASNNNTPAANDITTGDATAIKNEPALYQDTTKGKTKVYTKVEFEPDYPGGEQGWIKYLISHLKYPPAAVKKNIQGTVLMEFIVNTDGSISDVKAVSGPEELKASSIRVIKESGSWVPAKQDGVKVKAYKRQPITYKLA